MTLSSLPSIGRPLMMMPCATALSRTPSGSGPVLFEPSPEMSMTRLVPGWTLSSNRVQNSMADPIRFLHLSDFHVGASHEHAVNGVNTERAIRALLADPIAVWLAKARGVSLNALAKRRAEASPSSRVHSSTWL